MKLRAAVFTTEHHITSKLERSLYPKQFTDTKELKANFIKENIALSSLQIIIAELQRYPRTKSFFSHGSKQTTTA